MLCEFWVTSEHLVIEATYGSCHTRKVVTTLLVTVRSNL